MESEKERGMKNKRRGKRGDASRVIGGKGVGDFERYVGEVWVVF